MFADVSYCYASQWISAGTHGCERARLDAVKLAEWRYEWRYGTAVQRDHCRPDLPATDVGVITLVLDARRRRTDRSDISYGDAAIRVVMIDDEPCTRPHRLHRRSRTRCHRTGRITQALDAAGTVLDVM